MSKKTYTCTRTIEHDQVRHEEGDPIELDEKQAAPLLACGAVEDADGEAKPARKKK